MCNSIRWFKMRWQIVKQGKSAFRIDSVGNESRSFGDCV